MKSFKEFLNEEKYKDFDEDFWEKFTNCIKDQNHYKLKKKGNKTTIFYDGEKVGIYDHKEISLETDDTSYFILPTKCE
jgi:hypothetical protein